MKQFIAYPICWELNFDKNRHSVRVYECFSQNKAQNNIFGEIPVAIAESESTAKENLILEAKYYFSNLRSIHSTISDGDINFCFMIKEIKEGLANLNRNMVMREKL